MFSGMESCSQMERASKLIWSNGGSTEMSFFHYSITPLRYVFDSPIWAQ